MIGSIELSFEAFMNLRDINLDYPNFPTSRQRTNMKEKKVRRHLQWRISFSRKKHNSLESHDNVY